jgi:hypothetical protein
MLCFANCETKHATTKWGILPLFLLNKKVTPSYLLCKRGDIVGGGKKGPIPILPLLYRKKGGDRGMENHFPQGKRELGLNASP